VTVEKSILSYRIDGDRKLLQRHFKLKHTQALKKPYIWKNKNKMVIQQAAYGCDRL